MIDESWPTRDIHHGTRTYPETILPDQRSLIAHDLGHMLRFGERRRRVVRVADDEDLVRERAVEGPLVTFWGSHWPEQAVIPLRRPYCSN